MGTFNASKRFDHARHFVDDQVGAVKSGLHRIAGRVMTQSDGSPSRIRRWSTQATETVKAHPYLAVGLAVGLGYAIVRIVRR